MDEKRKEGEILELTADETDELVFKEPLANGEYDEEVPEYYFSNPDPYAKVEPRPDDAPKREFTFDEKGNIVVKKFAYYCFTTTENCVRFFYNVIAIVKKYC